MPSATQSLRAEGMAELEIYLIGNRLFMIVEEEAEQARPPQPVVRLGIDRLGEQRQHVRGSDE